MIRGQRRLRYEQVIELVEGLISSRGLRPGDPLPTINELAERAGVSPITVRRALDELERAGRISRHQGVGTFVADPRIVSEPARAGALLSTLNAGGPDEVRTKLIAVTRGRPTPAVARVLGLEDEDVWQVDRLRLIRGRPAILEQAVLPTSLVPRLDRRRLASGGSLYRFLEERYGLRDDSEEQYLEVVSPSEAEREHLELRPRDRVARIRGVSLTGGGVPFDSFQQAYPASDFVFYFAGRTARHVLRAAAMPGWGVQDAGTATG
jgi:DNA-binding GntR family transcriptional regulator